MSLQVFNQFQPLPINIRIELVDESGKHYLPHEVNPVDYLSRFLNKCVVNKVCREMIARKKAGVIEVYQDRIIVKEN
ncbi:MAG: hypothetical protein C5B59_16945 [Bacteroidetes bacterium]|nr:MAG: hypothetical protein C5B59_16945 [Bacteroidota bacterium]